MRLPRITASFALTATALATAGLFVAAPAAAQEGLPTYTCQQWMPVPLIWPPMAAGSQCATSNGAPEEGDLNQQVRITVPVYNSDDTVSYICTSSSAVLDDSGTRVSGRDCSQEGMPR